MIDFTPAVRPWFMRWTRRADSWTGRVREVQTSVLDYLLRRGAATRWGAGHGLDPAGGYDGLRRAVPVPVGYDRLRPYVMRMVQGEADVLWPGVTRRFAQSSGTSDGKSKYIPITADSLRMSHYAGGTHSVASYLRLYPDSRLFSGRSFILGGSYANELTLPRGVRVGDLSATLIDCINPLAALVRVPSKRIALMESWERKLPALAEASRRMNVTNISGVPSWFLTVLREVLRRSGADNLADVWPGLEVFFHGGIAMGPYRSQYASVCPPGMRYLECYNASEGFFAVQDRREPGPMRLLLDCGTFYEFIPLADVDSDRPALLPAWQVEEGRTYAMVITSVNGLWRFPIGDTVRIESLEPLRITVAGRTRSFINAFGEELMVHNADAAIERVCRDTGALVLNYTAAPMYAATGRKGRHEWMVEFAAMPPAGVADFAARLDRALRDVNSDYDAKRTSDIFLDPLLLHVARPGLFDDWLASTGKLGGQRKVPRLCNDRRIFDPLLRMNNNEQNPKKQL